MNTLWFSKVIQQKSVVCWRRNHLPDDKHRRSGKRPFCVGYNFSVLTFQGYIGNKI